jgi:hypothetical protein
MKPMANTEYAVKLLKLQKPNYMIVSKILGSILIILLVIYAIVQGFSGLNKTFYAETSPVSLTFIAMGTLALVFIGYKSIRVIWRS